MLKYEYPLEFEVKFVGSQHNHTSGRVQVFYDGIWAEICSDFGSFFTRNGQTVCAQLGYTYHSDYGYAEGQQKFGSPDSNVTISFLCYGNKDNIGSCAYSVNTCANSGLYLACTPPGESLLTPNFSFSSYYSSSINYCIKADSNIDIVQ